MPVGNSRGLIEFSDFTEDKVPERMLPTNFNSGFDYFLNDKIGLSVGMSMLQLILDDKLLKKNIILMTQSIPRLI